MMWGAVIGSMAAILIAMCLHKYITSYRLIIKKSDANSIMKVFVDDALKHKGGVPSVLYSGVLSTEGMSRSIQDQESLDLLVNVMTGYFKPNAHGCFEDKYGNIVVMEIGCFDGRYVSMRFEVYEGIGAFSENAPPVHVTKKYKLILGG